MDILKLFQYNQKLKFSDIERALKVRSNKLAYHLNNLTKKGILTKEGNTYMLTETSEYLIPYISEKQSILPVILIHLGNNKQAFLYKRTKRPYNSLLSMPGGRILVGESLEETVKRIMKEKHNINAKLKEIHSISLEQVKNKQSKIIHSFFLIFASAKTKDPIQTININQNKNKIIPSDYKLLKENLKKQIDIKTIFSKTN